MQVLQMRVLRLRDIETGRHHMSRKWWVQTGMEPITMSRNSPGAELFEIKTKDRK